MVDVLKKRSVWALYLHYNQTFKAFCYIYKRMSTVRFKFSTNKTVNMTTPTGKRGRERSKILIKKAVCACIQYYLYCSAGDGGGSVTPAAAAHVTNTRRGFNHASHKFKRDDTSTSLTSTNNKPSSRHLSSTTLLYERKIDEEYL